MWEDHNKISTETNQKLTIRLCRRRAAAADAVRGGGGAGGGAGGDDGGSRGQRRGESLAVLLNHVVF